MLYLNKLLTRIKEDSTFLKKENLILNLGLSCSEIKNLKKIALENCFIKQNKQEILLTTKGEEYLSKNPVIPWITKEFPLRDEINLEYLKEEKSPTTLTRAIRLYARHLLESKSLKENSLEMALKEDVDRCKKIYTSLEKDILNGKKNKLENLFSKYTQKGFTKSIISAVLLKILAKNIQQLAIYEKSQFQLKLDSLMFDRIMACPQNFEVQKTVIEDIYILKDISKIILNKKTENILEITKELYRIIKSFDKYTMNTQNLNSKTLRLRNVIVNAKDPISLFERDIPKVLCGKVLQECNRDFLNCLKLSLDEMKKCTENLIKDLKKFIYKSFNATSKEELAERFLAIQEYISDKELKTLSRNIEEINIDDDLWTNRIATFINKYRVPKDWTDEDYADFKLKTKELALKFFVLEATLGTSDCMISKNFKTVFNNYLKLSKQEQMILLRKAINA